MSSAEPARPSALDPRADDSRAFDQPEVEVPPLPEARWLWRLLAAALAVLCAGQLATWLPHYLTWPWWSDHDVFASAALAWDAGVVPYQDFQLNNLPGTIYLFAAIGRLAGWGVTWPLYAFDAALLVLLGALLWRWSCRRFGSALPGLAGFALFVSYYLELNYALVAQRDWHGPFFLLAALVVLQTWPGRAGWMVAGASVAIGLSIRPQVALFVPALVVALDQQVRPRGAPWRQSVGPLLVFAVSSAVGGLVLLLPLIGAGAFDDFIAGLGTLAPGRSYSRTNPMEVVRQGILQLSAVKLIVVPLVVALLWSGASDGVRRPAAAWTVAYAGALAYAPLSPSPHLYLRHPLILFWSLMAALLVAMAIEARRWPTAQRAALVLLVLASGVVLKPHFSDPGRSLRALSADDSRVARRSPPGYTAMGILPNFAARYAWHDYEALLAYLRELPSSTRVGNALYGVPALGGPSGRVPLFPAESIALLVIVGAEAEGAFVDALHRHADSVVVWSPSEVAGTPVLALPRLFETIETLYEPDQRFGEIEVWRRRSTVGDPPPN